MDTPMKSVEQSQQETRQNDMQVRKQLSKIYRLFSSKKYMKYKHQFPRMKQTEIVNKIIKEWEDMSKEEKMGLKEIYSKREMLDSQSENSDFSNERVKEKESVQKETKKQLQKKEETPDNKIQLQKSKQQNQVQTSKLQNSQQSINHAPQKLLQQKRQEIQIQDFFYKSQDQNKQSQEQNQQSEKQSQNPLQQKHYQHNSQSVSPNNKLSNINKIKNNKKLQNIISKQQQTIKTKKKLIKKQKPIKKQPIKKQINYSQLKNGQYILFYKYYYKKLKQQHPKWSQTQITFIIKLLWKKHSQKQKVNKLSIKQQKKQALKQSKPKRSISGKQYFTIQKNKLHLTKQEVNLLWKQLPRESKNDWNMRAANLNLQSRQNQRSKQDSNIKSETTNTKTQGYQRKQKTVVTFRDLLLKGKVNRTIQGNIIEQKKESSFPEPISQQKTLRQLESEKQQYQLNKDQDVQYVSLQPNPFSFMMKKIDNKIILQ